MKELYEDERHKIERGLILLLLINSRLKAVPVHVLLSMMEGQGYPLGGGSREQAMQDLDVHLTYLDDAGYVERRNLREGSLNLSLQTVRAKGIVLNLRDGRIPPDPGIRFPGAE